jgi:hypothetical protein
MAARAVFQKILAVPALALTTRAPGDVPRHIE